MHEQLPIDECNPIIARRYNYNRFTYPWHFHDEYEIIYIQEGNGEYFVADKIGNYSCGDVYLLGSNLPHYMKSAVEYFSKDNTKRVKGVVVQFQKDFMAYSINNYIDLKPIKNLLELSKRGILFFSSGNQELIKRIEKLPSYKGINRLVSLLFILDCMAKSNHKKLLGSRQFNNSLSLFSDDRLEKILSYINYHYTEHLDLETIAAKIPMNASAFCRYFKEKTGKTFINYIIDLRIGYACKLLTDKKSDITQICISSGFNSITHFNRIFKRKTGLTPTRYRQQISE
ncbi:MAG: AraC family transcriptional regulator, partial [Massilibacteroides sp.]|nr:AraC family transcriptional regulator [Massilibacteroides sp.]